MRYLIEAQLLTYDENGFKMLGPHVSVLYEGCSICAKKAQEIVKISLEGEKYTLRFWDHFKIMHILPYIIN